MTQAAVMRLRPSVFVVSAHAAAKTSRLRSCTTTRQGTPNHVGHTHGFTIPPFLLPRRSWTSKNPEPWNNVDQTRNTKFLGLQTAKHEEVFKPQSSDDLRGRL